MLKLYHVTMSHLRHKRSFKFKANLKMSSDPLANFSCLDELAQVIYQSIYKFVVLSTVSQDEWHVHLGLAGSEGRWWHGSWKKEDIHRIFVCVCSLLSTPRGWRLGSPISNHLFSKR